jgi:hypothetical protein
MLGNQAEPAADLTVNLDRGFQVDHVFHGSVGRDGQMSALSDRSSERMIAAVKTSYSGSSRQHVCHSFGYRR